MPKKGPSSIEDRLHRIEGQIRAIEKMVEADEEISKSISLIEAVQSSLESVKLILIKERIKNNIQRELDEAVKMMR